ncbi:dethiobiotin synthase [Thalassotalea litorea]|uniref:ATP-dependent dethiobiotin synthetase BioD n=1 Tax=Thalassotalea litorea TaxID=2020715 RepID=A0A5R9INM4_9GAMM|nr:dethiobiotin synthase [Thalassotalea litorea]TLU66179.1 dethiobiotin synthase [Thalassotalea litorea]
MTNIQPKNQTVFVTATDTDAGKTYVSEKLIKLLVQTGKTVSALKPISAGCEWHNGELQNEDALCLKAAANAGQTLSQINPIAFEPPIAPHIAAAQQGDCLTVPRITSAFVDAQKVPADICLIEGAGGWRLPLNNQEFLSDFVKNESIPVIFVVGMKLGCLNHAILTYQAMIQDGIDVIGWIANQAQPEKMRNHQDNVEFLTSAIDAPFLGELGFGDSEKNLKQSVILSALFEKDN